MTILDTLTAPASAILSSITSQAWQPLVSVCKSGTIAQLHNIQVGRLVLFEGVESKTENVFGADKEGVPVAYLHVHDERFWVRLALFADMVRVGSVYTNVWLQDKSGLTRRRVSLKATCLENSAHQT